MKKYIVMLLMVMLMFTMGCVTTSIEPNKFKTICLDGVTYYILKEIDGNREYGYMSVKLDTNSKIVPCDKNTPSPDFKDDMGIVTR